MLVLIVTRLVASGETRYEVVVTEMERRRARVLLKRNFKLRNSKLWMKHNVEQMGLVILYSLVAIVGSVLVVVFFFKFNKMKVSRDELLGFATKMDLIENNRDIVNICYRDQQNQILIFKNPAYEAIKEKR